MSGQTASQNNKAPPTIHFDAKRYDDLLQDVDMTPDQREQLLRTIWDTLVAFIDLGFQVDLPPDNCGQDAGEGSGSTIGKSSMLGSIEPVLTEAFASKPEAHDVQERKEPVHD